MQALNNITFEFTAGILLCHEIREFLESCKFKGFNIKWREGKGFIERDWIISGSEKEISYIKQFILKNVR